MRFGPIRYGFSFSFFLTKVISVKVLLQLKTSIINLEDTSEVLPPPSYLFHLKLLNYSRLFKIDLVLELYSIYLR